MEEPKHPLKSWFSQHVALEEVRQAESTPHHLVASSDETPSLPEMPAASLYHYRFYTLGLGATVLIVGLLWLLSAVYLSKIQLGSAKLAANISDKPLASQLEKAARGYKLTIERPDKTRKQYSLADMGFTLDTSASIKHIHEQVSWQRRLKWWQPIPVQLELDKNGSTLNNFIATAVNLNVQPSKDAALSIDNGQIKISDAVTGKQYGLIRPHTDLMTAASSMQAQPIRLRTLTVRPALSSQILQPYKATLEKTINQPISFSIGGRLVKPTPADVAGWLEITPNDQSHKVDIAVNSGKVQEYIDALAKGDIHPSKAQIEVRQDDGSTKVLIPGVNGSDVVNKRDAATAVASSLLNGQGISTNLNISYQAFQTITTNSYDKWIEVDLTSKRMYAYERDNLVRTELVSAGAPATPTVTGQFAIYSKYTQQDMRGQNVDGSNYFQPNVKWINYFYRDYAIHGNYWRPLSYFGNINSSHGCVGLVDSEAAWVYDWAPIGTPVIVHT